MNFIKKIKNTFSFFFVHSKILKFFWLPFFAVFPVALGSSFCFLLPKHVLKVEGQGMFNFYIDFLIRRVKNKWFSCLRNSKVSATLFFSILNAFVITGMLKKSSVNFWFTSVTPLGDINENVMNENKCKLIHGDSKCSEFFKNVSL
jgi:hypothetical protein